MNFLLLNFTENFIIDNNIFGLIIYCIKIVSVCDNQIKLFSTKNSREKNANDFIEKDDIIKVEINNNKYNEINCELKYQLIIT